ncbi:DUF3455 domain-containing protein [Acetobacter sacchari]|uniref:DUF3455 domain-containing protein n=1 Tax=Acetobacter sacchari TaxID=2661687 RepID=A0ABS3LWE7_9PROT|nr:DUF3455 domain-containing protein [Acetobacter sacchari]MBO1360242.1 DUF3455 domain-containing protein [Acetobacter sacchari]
MALTVIDTKKKMIHSGLIGLTCVAISYPPTSGNAQSAPFNVADRTEILEVRAFGIQLYECRADTDGKTVWALREPVATLIDQGKTVGRHYAGPTWQFNDAGTVSGKLLTTQPGATAADVPLLKLAVVSRPSEGPLKDVAFILRLDTRGGALKGLCRDAGALQAEPYDARYVFLR